jgi:hypothetical protein
MFVPGPGAGDVNQAPKLIGHIDLHSAERHARYIKVGGAVIGIAIVLTVVCALHFRNAWERENASQLLTLKGQADAAVQAREYEKAKGKYDEFFGLLGDRVLADEHVKSEIESARLAVTENDKRVEAILAVRAQAEQENQRSIAQTEAIEAARRPRERYYRDSHGAIVSETETENTLSRVRSRISSMPDNAERAYLEGQLQALVEEWERMKRQGPVDK